MTVPPLAGVEAQALHLLTQAVAILRRRGVHNPEAVLWRVVDQHVWPHARSRTPEPWAPPKPHKATAPIVLAPREADVLGAFARGLTFEEVAAELGITEHNTRAIAARMAQRLGAKTPMQAVTWAVTGRVHVAARRKQQTRRAA